MTSVQPQAYWTTMCLHCHALSAVVRVKNYDCYPSSKDRPATCEPAAAHIVRGGLACGHNAAFITTWRQLQPHVSPIGATR